jgi:hypothetical protein
MVATPIAAIGSAGVRIGLLELVRMADSWS